MIQSLIAMKFFIRTKEFVLRHRRRMPTVALFFGLIWDSITLGRPDQLYDNIVLLFYLTLAGALIIFLNRRQQKTDEEISLWLLLLLQFSFGNLTSGLFIIYGQSGTLVGNWPFMLLLVGFLVGNEFLRGRYTRILYHVAIYYLLVFSYLVLIMPILFRDIGIHIFLISGFSSIVAIALFIFIVKFFAPRLVLQSARQLVIIVGVIYVSFNMLYLLNLIPPVPLSLKDIGIYHSVIRDTSGNYLVEYERGEWYEFWKRSDNVLHYTSGDSAYCFSSVFAPSRLDTVIYHQWEYFDEQSRTWKASTRTPFSITGGREEGFRGFSTKSALFPGRWRCDVETERGGLIGRRSFGIVESSVVPELVSGIR